MNVSRPRLADVADVIDVVRFPIAGLGGESDTGRALVRRCIAALEAEGACQLDALVRPEAIKQILEETAELTEAAFRTEATHNPYFTELLPDGDTGDPRGTSVRSAKRAIGWKHLPDSSPLRTLYEWDGLVTFLQDVLQLESLYRDADPVGACSVMLYDEGDELGWHFDNSEFAVTLMLQDCEAGGAYEYVPWIRTADDENYGAIARVLAGDRLHVRSLHPPPGTLTLFQGRYSMHCVTPVEGATPRINAVLAFAQVPDHQLTPATRHLFYGADR